jgi:hypothetical protein
MAHARYQRKRYSEGVEMTATLNPNIRKHTDLMHRRAALDLEARYQWSGLTLRIKTNSAAVLQAATKAGFTQFRDSGHKIDFHWEIIVEAASGVSKTAPSVQTVRDEQMLLIEPGTHDWFALDLETGDGAGFCEIGEAEEAINGYFQHVTGVIKPWLLKPRPEAASCD